MNATRLIPRDLELTSAAGDTGLARSERDVASLVERELAVPGAPSIEGVELSYARWKPRTSLTTMYAVRFADGGETSVTLKTYLEGKDRHVAEHFAADRHFEVSQERLAPFAVTGSTCLWAFPADRVLRGLSRATNKRRTARMVDTAGTFAPLVVRLRPTELALLRYKPERRAVFRLDAKLRGEGGERALRRLGVRVLTPDVIEGVVRRRTACAPNATRLLVPELVRVEPSAGILLEEWVAGEPFARDDFHRARLAGETLAALHARPAGGAAAPLDPRSWDGLAPLFEVDGALAAKFSRLTPPRTRTARCWVHGDFHPDQLVAGSNGDARLVDLDALHVGDPRQDLASWVADHLAHDPELSLHAATAPLLAGYRAGGAEPPDESELAREVGAELVERSAAAIRRLERGAVERATRLLELAVLVAPELRRSS